MTGIIISVDEKNIRTMADERNQKTNRENSNQNVEQTRNRTSDLKRFSKR
jgi:hypothetical protein